MLKSGTLRTLFVCFSVLLTVGLFSHEIADKPFFVLPFAAGAALISGGFLYGAEWLTRKSNLRSLNILIIGLIVGYLLGSSLLMPLKVVLNQDWIDQPLLMAIQSLIYLISTYLSIAFTVKSADDLHLSIPFVKFNPAAQKKKDILVDLSVLIDSRIIDIAGSGLLDNHLVVPKFLVSELNEMTESEDENIRNKGKKCLDVLKKLEIMPQLDLQYSETDFQEIKDPLAKYIRLARLIDAHLMTADMSRIQHPSIEGIKVININTLSNALKPITQTGELISITVQRYGKEPRQGVGYLDDGTMVVVNGGAEYIGESIKAQVLSVKHTSSGRMIFCNVAEKPPTPEAAFVKTKPIEENIHRKYLSL